MSNRHGTRALLPRDASTILKPMEKPDATLDTLGLLCPVPIIKTAKRMKAMEVGQILEILSDDAGIEEDMPAWCRSHGQGYLGLKKEKIMYRAFVKKLK